MLVRNSIKTNSVKCKIVIRQIVLKHSALEQKRNPSTSATPQSVRSEKPQSTKTVTNVSVSHRRRSVHNPVSCNVLCFNVMLAITCHIQHLVKSYPTRV